MVWGVNRYNKIYYRDGINGEWKNIVGSLTQIARVRTDFFLILLVHFICNICNIIGNILYNIICNILYNIICNILTSYGTYIISIFFQLLTSYVMHVTYVVFFFFPFLYTDLYYRSYNLAVRTRQTAIGNLGVFGIDTAKRLYYRVGTHQSPTRVGTIWQRYWRRF